MGRAAIYRRVSTPGQVTDGASLESQLVDCEALCRSRGLRVVASEFDVHTGSELDERPGLSAIRRLMHAQHIDTLVVWKLDRLSRNQTHQAVVAYEAQKYGVNILSCTEEFDDSPIGRHMQSTYTLVGELERLSIRERSMRGMETRLSKGLPTGRGRAPYGYTFGDERRTHYLINPYQASVVERIFVSVAKGKALRALARELSEEGVPTPFGAEGWNPRTLSWIIRNGYYWGEPATMRWTVKSTKHIDELTGRPYTTKRVVSADPTKVRVLDEAVVPAIVSRELAMAAQAAIKERITQPEGNNKAPHAYLLRAGFARCGICGSTMSSYMRPGNRPTYRCCEPRGEDHQLFSVAAGKVDTYVWERVKDLIGHPDILLAVYERAKEAHPDLSAWRLDGLKAELVSIERASSRLAQIVEEDDSPLEELKARYASLKHKRQEVLDEIRQAEAEQRDWTAVHEGVASFIGLCRNMPDPDLMTYEEKRTALRLWGIQTRVFPKAHEPRWEVTAYPFSFSGAVPTEKNSTIIFPLGPVFEAAKAGLSGFSLRPTADGAGWQIAQEAAPTQPLVRPKDPTDASQ